MKSFTRTTLFRSLVVVLLLTTLAFAQGTPFGNGRGAFRGQVYVPSVFGLTFGDNTSTDVTLNKNGSNVVGITGNIGGSGSTANTTTAPAGPFAWGQVTLVAGAATVTFAKQFTNVPVCTATYVSGAATGVLKAAPTATTLVFADSVSETPVVAYTCFGNPN